MSDEQLLDPAEDVRIREGIAHAVLGVPDGLAESLERDPAGFLRLLAASRVGAEESSRLLREAVQQARAAGHSWDAVGRVLGVSRQAAQQRFAAKDGPGATAPGLGGPEQRVLTPLTAFNEMAALEAAGREGWQLVRYGPLYHVVEASDRRWEYRRVPMAFGPRHRRMEAEGWTPVGAGVFPWRYYKRPLDDAADDQAR
ncbi:hypothetical protein ACIQGZ_03205 [Streptomyces sp. NPDC092296]|uniref:hypothetical protein n=1 Tax=Streptomyces sp. NPDC092296 TaxID=3366012 RepID=UPI0037FABE3D